MIKYRTAGIVFYIIIAALAIGCATAPATPLTKAAPTPTAVHSSGPGLTPSLSPTAPSAAISLTPSLTPVSTASSAIPTPSATFTAAPSISIMQPATNTYVVGTKNITVVVQVSGFELVDSTGRPNVPGQGHINYFFNVEAPTNPGQPAVTAKGTYAASASTSYQWSGLVDGVYTFSAELVNNDNTPLVPPVVAESTVSVYTG